MHPQEFTVIENETYTNLVNDKQISELVLLIETSKFGIAYCFEDIGQYAEFYKILIPEWLEKILQWRNEKKITGTEFSDAMNYLKR